MGAAPVDISALPSPDTYGVLNDTITVLHASAFVPRTDGVTYSINSTTGYLHAEGAAGFDMIAPLSLPDGVLLKDVLIEACDNDDTAAVSVILSECGTPGTNCTFDVDFAVDTGTSETTGCYYFSADPPAPLAMQGWFHSYFLNLSTGGTTSIRAVGLRWQRRVSPLESGTIVFTDVTAGHPQKQYIDALGRSGISAGCGGGKYCPDNPVTRGQLAVMLARALGLHWPSVP